MGHVHIIMALTSGACSKYLCCWVDIQNAFLLPATFNDRAAVAPPAASSPRVRRVWRHAPYSLALNRILRSILYQHVTPFRRHISNAIFALSAFFSGSALTCSILLLYRRCARMDAHLLWAPTAQRCLFRGFSLIMLSPPKLFLVPGGGHFGDYATLFFWLWQYWRTLLSTVKRPLHALYLQTCGVNLRSYAIFIIDKLPGLLCILYGHDSYGFVYKPSTLTFV